MASSSKLKSKASSGKGVAQPEKAKPTTSKSLTSVKEGRVGKSSLPAKTKNKELTKKVVSKKAKEETPSESESEPESESQGTSSSSESSESESEIDETPAKANGASKANGAAKGISSPLTASPSENESEPDSEAETPAKKGKAVKANGAAKVNAKAESSSGSEADSESEDEAPKPKGPVDAKELGGALENARAGSASADDSASATSGGSASSDEEASGSDDSSSESEEDEAPAKKRKADTEPAMTAKKTKIEVDTSGGGLTNLFVGSLSWNIDEEWLAREFEEFGEVTSCRIITERDSGRSKGFGYVTFATHEAAAKALEEKQGVVIDGRALNVDWSQPRDNSNSAQAKPRASERANKFGDQRNPPSSTVFLGNLSFDVTPDAVRDEFDRFGTITRVSLPTDRETGAIRGFGYVDFTAVEEAQAALDEMSGAKIMGRPLRLDFGKSRDENASPRGGRGGFTGGRGGRGGFSDRGGGRGRGAPRGGGRGGRGGSFGSTNRGGVGEFKGSKVTFD